MRINKKLFKNFKQLLSEKKEQKSCVSGYKSEEQQRNKTKRKEIAMLRRIVNMIPNSITLCNLLSGCVAICFAFKADESIGLLKGWQLSALAMGVAAIFDFCDGLAARLLHAKSAIGKELDSLADLVSFGVAPGLLLMNVMQSAEAGDWSYAALLIPAMGALRLAKFNVDDTQSTTFKGLPIPANAIFWIGAVAAIYEGLEVTLVVAILSIVAMSLLMVCNLPMFSLKMTNFKLLPNLARYVIVIAAVALVATLGLPGLAATILLYVVISFLQLIVKIEVKE